MAGNETGAMPSLRAFDIGCVVVGGIIGVGIFFTPAEVARAVDTPWQVVVAWSLGGVLAILGALVFAALSRAVHGFGGTFAYVRAAFGDLPAFLYGWCNWLVIQAGALGIIGIVLVDHAAELVHGADTAVGETTRIAIAALAIVAFTLLNCLGLRVGKAVQNALTVAKTAAVFGLVVLALFATGTGVRPVVVADAAPRDAWLALGAAMLPVLFAFGGWQQGAFVAGAARRPERDVPLGLLFGVAVVVVAYLTVNLAFLDLLGFEGAARSETIALDAVRVALGEDAASEFVVRLFAAAVVVSALGIMNTICMAPPYVLHAMAKERLFFAAAAHRHPRHGAPVFAVLAQGMWAVVLLMAVHVGSGGGGSIDALGFLLSCVVCVDWVFFAGCAAALLVLARRGVPMPPFARTVAVVFGLGSLAVVVGGAASEPGAAATGAGLLMLGLPAFAAFRRHASRRTGNHDRPP